MNYNDVYQTAKYTDNSKSISLIVR